MYALVKEGLQLQLQELPTPQPCAGEVLIRVRAAGLCRTDQLVIQGRLPARDPLIPGHELAGEIAAVGPEVRGLQPGDRVTVHPLIGCGSCPSCRERRPEHCRLAQMLGVERHGAFAEYLCLPAHAVWKLPDALSWCEGAYTEPLAAALGVLRAGITPEQIGWITGQNRIATLTARLLERYGCRPGQGALAEVRPESLDYVIETGLDAGELAQALQALRPGGVLIAKSRHLGSLPLPWNLIVRKDLRIQGFTTGSFDQALALLDSELVSDLIGTRYGIEQWETFVAPAPEALKPFLVLG